MSAFITGSTAILTVGVRSKRRGLKICGSRGLSRDVIVAVFTIAASTPSSRTQLPAGTLSTSMKYLETMDIIRWAMLVLL